MADEKESKFLSTAELARQLKVKPSALRRLLRKLGKNADQEYRRYQFKPGSREIEGIKKALAEQQERVVENRKALGQRQKSKKVAKKATSKRASKKQPAVEEAEGVGAGA
jgi:DNA-binding MurR/RpiR family transcriptional regulator